jgi:hypothetical protein
MTTLKRIYTGYYIVNNFIFGPRKSGQDSLVGNSIYGPKSKGEYTISGGKIYGPNTTPPWL